MFLLSYAHTHTHTLTFIGAIDVIEHAVDVVMCLALLSLVQQVHTSPVVTVTNTSAVTTVINTGCVSNIITGQNESV